ncbi:MAG: NADH-quinone oxidoreductase subunit H [Bryobacterales bacterium]|nr:NADH-quinone oxidoreductase subunit H [Bryobacterales bacterium]
MSSPATADRTIFWLAPCISTFTALTGLAMLPFAEKIFLADVNVGLLVILSMSSVGVLGIILGGWASNSHYPLLGALRASAQLISYEVAIAFALESGLMLSGTLSLQGIIRQQLEQGVWFGFANFGFMLIPFAVFLIAATAEVNRAPFDMPEAESELVAGFHTEYSGFRWALYFLAEYANMFVVSGVAVTMFLGGWLHPFPSVGWLTYPMQSVVPAAVFIGSGVASLRLLKRVPSAAQRRGLLVVCALLVLMGIPFLAPGIAVHLSGLFWFLFKVALFLYLLIWLRGTFPRFRYDQLMNIGWKWLIPIGMASLLVNALLGMIP